MKTASLRSALSTVMPDPALRLAKQFALWRQRKNFPGRTITKPINGESFNFFIGDRTGELWYSPEKDPVYQELAFIRDRMLRPNDLVFDVGSHHGLHTICTARHATRVVAIEPNPHNVPILKQNIALNGLKNVTVCQRAVGACSGTIAILQDSNLGGVVGKSGKSPTVNVPLVTLDELASEYGFPDFVKIDVEGFEGDALKGASAVMAHHPKIAIEVHNEWVTRYGSSVDEVIGLLKIESYQVWVMAYTSGDVKPWDGQNFNAYPPPKFTLFLLP